MVCIMQGNSNIRSIGVIGTPGCGKTTLCNQMNLPILSVEHLAMMHDCLGEMDEDGSSPVDVEKLAKSWQPPEELTLIDGHLAHHLPVDALIILRCDPSILRKRLEARGYSEQKVTANVEVEMLGGPWPELLGDSRPKIEDTSNISSWIAAGCPNAAIPETAIDWL